MLHPKLINSYTCAEIPALISNIDCKLSLLSSDLYNNTVYMLNKQVAFIQILSLLFYKRILLAKYCNEEYACKFTVEQIASKVKLLTLGCKSNCNPSGSLVLPATTTSTTTSVLTTSTTSTTIPVTTTTTTSIACLSWLYQVELYLCDSCEQTGGGSIVNSEPLTIGNWYNYNGFKLLVIALITCSAGDPVEHILDSSGVATCEEVICPPTTTTTTTII